MNHNVSKFSDSSWTLVSPSDEFETKPIAGQCIPPLITLSQNNPLRPQSGVSNVSSTRSPRLGGPIDKKSKKILTL